MERHYDVGDDRFQWSDPSEWEGMDVFDQSGEKIGDVEDVYLDDLSGRPEWLQVDLGIFRGKRLVPVRDMQRSPNGLYVPHMKDEIKDGPSISGDTVTLDEERELFAHYGLPYDTQSSPRRHPEDVEEHKDRPASDVPPGMPGAGVSREQRWRERDQDDQYTSTSADQDVPSERSQMRNQPDMGIRTVRRPRELVRLKKRIVREPVQTTLPLEREELVVERIPISESGEVQGVTPQEEGQEIVLEGEDVVVEGQEGEPGEPGDSRAA